MNGSLKHGQKILKEIDSSTIATKEDIHLYAQHLGIVLPDEQDLLWIAQAGLEVSLPPPWCPVEDSQGRIYYYNSVTKETKWEHPLDSYYKTMVKKERLKASARAATADSNIEDSGTSLMSSLDDVPPLSSFAKVSVVVDQTIVPFTRLQKAKKGFLSKSCPTNLHMLSIKSGPLVKQHDTDSESHTATLQNEDERPDMKELLARKQALELELERLKREVQKYQRIREQLRASTKKDLIQFGVTSLTYRSRHHRHNMVTDGRQDHDTLDKRPPALPGDASGAKAKDEGSKQQAKPSTAPCGRSSLGHKDLLRLSQRITQLRQRQLQLSLRAAQQVAEDALAGFAVPRTTGSDFTSKDLVAPSMKLAPSSSELVPHRPRRALTDVPHTHSHVEAPHGGPVSQYWGPHTSQLQDVQPTQQWSRAEWTAKLSQLRWSLKECELQQLLIK